MNYIYILYTQAPNIGYIYKIKSENENLKLMYSVADTLLRWDEISLQRDLFKKATYTAFTLYTLCTERLTGT